MSDKYTHLILHTDGGSRNNPGAAGIGIVIHTSQGEKIYSEGMYIGTKTNNEAEYTALLRGVSKICELYPDCSTLEIFADSELMVRQLLGIYKIREPGLKIIADQIKHELSRFNSFTITHILRKFNKDADALVNQALDRAGF